ncbi:MAG: hypothetical protein KatS3mg090_0368 [Patescibacteria group bacterium]|nr:MAG: hypothetical protein KatS3mg090_0368 [Patescibacteria group bacterium]
MLPQLSTLLNITILDADKHLLPGCILEFSLRSQKIELKTKSVLNLDKFVNLLNQNKDLDDKTYAFEPEDLIFESIKKVVSHLPNNTSISCEVSSGFDCTLVAYALANIIGPENFYCYSFVFPDQYGTESFSTINNFVKHHNLQLRFINIDPITEYSKDYFNS